MMVEEQPPSADAVRAFPSFTRGFTRSLVIALTRFTTDVAVLRMQTQKLSVRILVLSGGH